MKTLKLTQAETDFLRMELQLLIDEWVIERNDCKRLGTQFSFTEELRAAKSIMKKIAE